LKSEISPGILKTADSSGLPGSESPAGLEASPGVGGSMDSSLGIVGSSFMDTFRMSCTDCNRSVLDSASEIVWLVGLPFTPSATLPGVVVPGVPCSEEDLDPQDEGGPISLNGLFGPLKSDGVLMRKSREL